MAPIAAGSNKAKEIDRKLSDWRQGDLALDELWFVHVGDAAVPLSEAAAQTSGAGPQSITSEVAGLVVVTQTCDIVRCCTDRPYIEVAPLVKLNAEHLAQVKRGRRPQYGALPAIEKDCLVADLDRVMTVEKSVVANWTRTPGYEAEADGRAFAQALARKRVRFAFPDDFTSLIKKLQSRLVDKHEKDSNEGRALRALREIRVNAWPSWDEQEVNVFIWFIRNDDTADFEGQSWSVFLDKWLNLVPASGRFKCIEGQVSTLADLTAGDYLDSDPLDLDHLSST